MSFAMTLPAPIRWVVDRLEGAGYEAYVVGGWRAVETGLALSLPCEGGTPREGKGVRTCPLQ